MLAPASSSRSRTRWTRSSTGSAARASSSAAAPARASTSRGCAPRRSSSRRAATPPARSRSCAAPTRPPARSSRAARRGARPRWSSSTSTTRTSCEFIWCKAHEEEKARVLEAAGYDMSLDSPDWASIQYQNANNSVRVSDAFMEAVDERRRLEPDRPHRRLRRRDDQGAQAAAPDRRGRVAAAPTRASSTTRRSTAWHTLPNTGRINASNPCSEYMSIDDSACNLASLNLMKFRREDGELDVEAFEHAVDVVFLAQEILVGYSSYPTPEIEREREGVPPARPRLREPRRAADGARAAVRLRRGPRLRRRDHRADDGPRVPQVGRDRRRGWARSPATGTNAAAMIGVIAKHRAAVGNIETADTVPGRPAQRRAGTSWDDALNLGEVARLPQRAGDRARADRDDQLHDGLRHDRRRARLLARQVEEARRRRRDHDRQQDGADGARQARLRAERGRARSSRTSTSATRSSARRT